jgi:hypothetical protein
MSGPSRVLCAERRRSAVSSIAIGDVVALDVEAEALPRRVPPSENSISKSN